MKFFGYNITKAKASPIDTRDQSEVSGLPRGRVNVPDYLSEFALDTNLKTVNPPFYWEMMPQIRRMFVISSPLQKAVSDLVQLANTGFHVRFSNAIDPQQRREMTEHLYHVSKNWGFGTAGVHGLIDKILYQLLLNGNSDLEWVIKKDLSGVDYLSFVDSETIRPVYNKRIQRFEYYQIPKNSLDIAPEPMYMKKLNQKTFVHYSLMTASESPIGIPPFLAAIPDINSHKNMLNNINFIVEQVGLMGFLELMMDKPPQKDGEGIETYRNRLKDFLYEAKTSLADGLKDGIIAGYKDDHEFKFNSISKDLASLPAIFSLVSRTMSMGLKTPSVFLEVTDSKTETQISIVFTKLLAQLTDIQNIVSHIIEYGFSLELLLAGYPTDGLKVLFDQSTISDALKKAQTDEITARVQHQLYADGVIELDDYAMAMGYSQASQEEPRTPLSPVQEEIDDQVQKDDRSKKNNESDKVVRDKKKAVPKTR
jgi:hypothetical protein